MRHEALEGTFYFKFTTRDFDTGSPQTLGGTPAISAYEDDNLTQITAGITLTPDFGGSLGLNHVAVVATTGNGYEEGKYYAFTIETGAVDSVSVVGEVVHEVIIGPQISDVIEWAGSAGAIKLGATDGLPQTSPHGWQGVAIPSGNMIEDSTGARWTAKALEQAPSGGGGAGNIDVSPASFMNDQVKNETSEIPWMTKDNTRVPIAPTVNGSVYAVEDGTTTKITAGITTSYNHGGENGAHLTSIDSSNAAFSPEATYSVYAEGMTVDGIVDTGAALASFTLRTQSIDDIYGNGLVQTAYDWDTDTSSTDPGSGNVKANNATYSLITEVFISGATQKGLNASGLIKALEIGDLVVVAKDKDTTKFFDGRVSGAIVDNGTWFTIPVIVATSGDSIANNDSVDVAFAFIRAALSPEQVAQISYRLQIDGDQSAPSVDAPVHLPIDVQAWDGDEAAVKVDATANLPSVNTGALNGLSSAAANAADFALEGYDPATNQVEGVKVTDTVTDKDGYSLAASITVKKGEALPQFQFQMVDTNDDPATGLTVTGQIAKDAGSLAGISNSIAEIGGGLYRINGGLTASETDADAFILNFTAPGAKTLAIEVLTQAE